jgi:hypothetical protein
MSNVHDYAGTVPAVQWRHAGTTRLALDANGVAFNGGSPHPGALGDRVPATATRHSSRNCQRSNHWGSSATIRRRSGEPLPDRIVQQQA